MDDGAVGVELEKAVGVKPDERGAAFEALASREYGRLRRLAWRFGLPADEIDDATQEILVRAWTAWGRFRGESAPETWLTRIAVNWLTSRRRAVLRRLKLFRREGDAPEPSVDAPDAEAVEAYARAVACVRRLPAKMRAAFVLRYLEGMSVAESARALGISEEAVRTRAFEARRRLRAMLEDET